MSLMSDRGLQDSAIRHDLAFSAWWLYRFGLKKNRT